MFFFLFCNFHILAHWLLIDSLVLNWLTSCSLALDLCPRNSDSLDFCRWISGLLDSDFLAFSLCFCISAFFCILCICTSWLCWSSEIKTSYSIEIDNTVIVDASIEIATQQFVPYISCYCSLFYDSVDQNWRHSGPIVIAHTVSHPLRHLKDCSDTSRIPTRKLVWNWFLQFNFGQHLFTRLCKLVNAFFVKLSPVITSLWSYDEVFFVLIYFSYCSYL